MTASTSDFQLRVDELILHFALDHKLFWQTLQPTPQSGQPYASNPSPVWGPEIPLTAWLMKDPANPMLEAARRDLLSLGHETNVDAVFLISEMERARKDLPLHEDMITARIRDGTRYYTILRVRPRSHVHGIPCYYRVTTTRTAGAVGNLEDSTL